MKPIDSMAFDHGVTELDFVEEAPIKRTETKRDGKNTKNVPHEEDGRAFAANTP